MMDPNEHPYNVVISKIQDITPPLVIESSKSERISEKIKRYYLYRICNFICFSTASAIALYTPSPTIRVISLFIIITTLVLFFVLTDKINKAHKERAEISYAEFISGMNKFATDLTERLKEFNKPE